MAAAVSIALGSNLGDRGSAIESAIRCLVETPGIERVRPSRLYETPPVGGPSGQGPFLNAAATLETTLNPIALHARVLEIERHLGRVRDVRWGERAIDIDILLYDNLILDTPELTIPHPRMAVRRFVLVPLAEVAAEAIDPLTKRTITSLLANLERRPGCVVLRGIESDGRVYRNLIKRLPSVGWLAIETGRGSFESMADFLADSAFADVNRVRSRHFPLDRWSETLADGRWLVTDFDFREILRVGTPPEKSPFRVDPVDSTGASPSRREQFLNAQAQILKATFVAATTGVDYGFERVWRASQADPVYHETPLLWPGIGDPWAKYQACLAHPAAGTRPEALSNDEVDEIVSGIVSACEASRTETRVVAF